MSADSNVAPVIIKRKKVVAGGGHHGGAWKVAYADFVTAMMAFFLLMWLLNATTEKQRKGIADYFNPTIAMARVSGGGDGALGGDSVFAENTLPRMGTGSTSLRATSERQSGKAYASHYAPERTEEDETFAKVEEALLGRSGESMVADEIMDHIVTRVTDEGLVVELFETREAPFFAPDGTATDLLRQLALVVAEVSRLVSNPVAVEGHTATYPVVLAQNPSWPESNRRAMLLRDLMIGHGLEDRRVTRVTAHADREPVQENPMDVRNNRLEVIFLRNL